MAASHEFLGRLLGHGALATYDWEEVRAAIHHVAATRVPESEDVLRRLLTTDFTVRLSEKSSAPHALSPEDMLRSVAIQALGTWNRRRHRDVIARVARTSHSDLLVAIARSHLAR